MQNFEDDYYDDEQVIGNNINNLNIDVQPNNVDNDTVSDVSNDSFHDVIDNNEMIVNELNNNENNESPPRYNLRNRNVNRQPQRFGIPLLLDNNIDMEELFITETETPLTYEDAMKGCDSHKWQKAMKYEYDALCENKTWELVDIPRNFNILKNRWVFKIKNNNEHKNKIYKARLVVKGFEQRAGIDCNETFSPVARHTLIRLFLSIAASEKMHLKQFDVKTAFLNGELNETVYMYQPEGFSTIKIKHVN